MLQYSDHRRQRNDLDTVASIQRTDEFRRHLEHTTKHADLSATPQAGDAPFYGVMLKIDSEYMRCVGISGTTVNVVRASAFNQVLSTPAAHSSGASITCYNRWPFSGVLFLLPIPNGSSSCRRLRTISKLVSFLVRMATVANDDVHRWIDTCRLARNDDCQVWPTGQYTFLHEIQWYDQYKL